MNTFRPYPYRIVVPTRKDYRKGHMLQTNNRWQYVIESVGKNDCVCVARDELPRDNIHAHYTHNISYYPDEMIKKIWPEVKDAA